VPPELGALYRQSVQNYIISWFARDPAAELAKVSAPVLIVQGTSDLQVLVADADRLAAARPGVRPVLIEGMNHVLKLAPAERAANLATYVAPGLPLAPPLVPAIAAFVAAR
jgi:pimeloyl-ACP methyl ester carboxylesterase